jgi:ATP-dependent helicase/nuclease subunit A
VMETPEFAAIFAPEALAEAPIAGVVEGRVIAGTVDRLLVSDAEVLIVDFKTGRGVPRAAETLPQPHVAQMAAYAAVLAGIFPDRPVRAALLYTGAPKLIEVPPEMLAAFKPGYRDAQNKLGQAG